MNEQLLLRDIVSSVQWMSIPALFGLHHDFIACFVLPLFGMTLSGLELDRLATAIADRLAERSRDRKDDGDEVGDVHDAARWLKCSVPTVERAVREKQIPSFKVGRLRRFRRADLLGMSAIQQGGQE